MPTQRVAIPGALGHPLAGQLERPDPAAFPEPLAWALLAHCFTCGKDLKSLVRLARALAERGVAVLRFDFTGIGESGGAFEETTFSTHLGDITAAADWLRAQHRAPELLIGHSLGGTASLAAAREVPESQLVVTIASPSSTARFRETLERRVPALAEGGEGTITLGGRGFRLRRHLLDDLGEHRMHEAIAQLGRALMVFHSPSDESLELEQALAIFEQAAQPKSFVTLPGADHLLFSDERDAVFVADVVAAWVRRHL
jgi:putative redox protein